MPFVDAIAFVCHWGFGLDEVKVLVRWWNGDHDHVIPFFPWGACRFLAV
nr:hypothetical protein [Mycobacterium lepromatosis]